MWFYYHACHLLQPLHLEFLLEEANTVVHRSVDHTIAMDPNGCCEVLHCDGPDFGVTMSSLSEELLVKAVAVPEGCNHSISTFQTEKQKSKKT